MGLQIMHFFVGWRLWNMQMPKYGALLAVLSNLENEDYGKIILCIVDYFELLL